MYVYMYIYVINVFFLYIHIPHMSYTPSTSEDTIGTGTAASVWRLLEALEGAERTARGGDFVGSVMNIPEIQINYLGTID